MKKEGQIRIPSGCAMSGFFSRNKENINRKEAIDSIICMTVQTA